MFPTYMLKFNIFSSAVTLKNACKYDQEMPCSLTARVPTHGTARKKQRTQQPRDNKKTEQSNHACINSFLPQQHDCNTRTDTKEYTTKGLFRVNNMKGDSSGVASLKKDGNTVGDARGKAEVLNGHFLSV